MAKDYEEREPPPAPCGRHLGRRRQEQASRRRGDEPGGGSVRWDRDRPFSTLPPRTPAAGTSAVGRTLHATVRKPLQLSRAVTSSQRKAPHTAPGRFGYPAISWSDSDESSGDFVEVTSRLVAERNRARQRQQFNWRDADWGASDSEDDDEFDVRQVIIKSLREGKQTKHSSRRGLGNGTASHAPRPKTAQKATFSECLESSRQTHKGEKKQQTKQLKGRRVEKADKSSASHSSGEESATVRDDIDYENIPEVPEKLDAHELKVYTKMKEMKFRLRKEKEKERHNKIIQDKTLCELIRRRRNDAGFASRKANRGNAKAVKADLMSVWGIGPSKAAKDGVGWELLDALDEEENVRRLKLSRRGVKINDDDSSDAKVINRRSRAQPQGKASSHRNRKGSSPSESPEVPRYVVFERRK